MKQILINLRDFILTHNKYFDKGYCDVVMDETTGYVHNDMPVFPADNLGNYFYLRVPNQVQFEYRLRDTIADNFMSVNKRSQVFLVACVKDADADLLAMNLEATIGRYQTHNTTLVQSIYQKESVLLQELAKMKKDNIQAALQRLPDNLTLVSINFNISFDSVFLQLSCIQNPCKRC